MEFIGQTMWLWRIIHILAGVFWVGTTLFLARFLGPTAKATAPESGKVMQYLLVRTRFIAVIILASSLTLLSGLIMYVPVSGAGNAAWATSPTGLALSIGALFGILGFFHGWLAVGRPNQKIAEIAREVMASGGPPSEEQMGQLQMLSGKVSSNSNITAILLVVAVLGMSLADAL